MSLNDPQFLISTLLKAETVENNNLIEILGLIKPARTSQSNKLTSIVRGLYTKNTQLLKLLTHFDKEISQDPVPMDTFKNLVNEFILWLENDGLVIFQKYLLLFPVDYDYNVFSKPMLHCANYISFMLHTNDILRNPFIIDKLSLFANQLNDLLYDYESHCEQIKLNNISFDNVKVFAEAPNHSKSLDKVSCFFKLDQIVERTKNEELILVNDGNKKIEMILLNLSNQILSSYNALALVAVPNSSNEARSLIYPPFRINELSISCDNTSIVLTALKFSKTIKTTDEIIISGKNKRMISDWFQKLSSIFPNSLSPIDNQFLIKPDSEYDMCGLGINTFDYPSPSDTSSPLSQLQKKASFQDLITTPSVSPNRKGTENPPIDDLQPPSAMPFVPRKNSAPSVHSVDSSTSLKSQYDRSLGIIHKTLSNHSLGQGISLQVIQPVELSEPEGSQFIKTVNRKDVLTHEELERPVSAHAQIHNENSPAISVPENGSDSEEFDFKEAGKAKAVNIYGYGTNTSLVELSDDYQKKQQNRFASVPNLPGTKLEAPPKSGIYQLSTGSAVDINNFGQSHNPSFSVHDGLSNFIEPKFAKPTNNSFSAIDLDATPPIPEGKKTRRKSLFSIFKRQPKTKTDDRKDSATSIGSSDSGATLAPPVEIKPQGKSEKEVQCDDKTATNSEDDSVTKKPVEKQPKLSKKQSKASLKKENSKTKVDSKPKSKKNDPKEKANQVKPQTELDSVPIPEQKQGDSKMKPKLKLDTGIKAPEKPTSFSPAPKSSAPSSALPSPFALPSSTSTYFFKNKDGSKVTLNDSTEQFEEDKLSIPQDLKDMINSDDSIDFYISPSTPKSMKVSRWKQKYGKWEMLTVNENLFLKIVADYDSNKSWLIFFKEEYDREYDEVIDKPILLMNIDDDSSIRQSSALDIQITAKDSITEQKLLIMIRCSTGSLSSAIFSNFNNISGVMKRYTGTKQLVLGSSPLALSSQANDSNNTISSSLMDNSKPSASSTYTSFASPVGSTIKQNKPYTEGQSQFAKDISLASLDSLEINNAHIISNPNNSKLFLLNKMTVRLQLQLESYEEINNPSSWKILSMYALSIYMISDNFTGKNYYNLIFETIDTKNDDVDLQTFNWLISEDDKFERVKRIGKAGLLIKATPDDIFMIECKGKKEFRKLYELF